MESKNADLSFTPCVYVQVSGDTEGNSRMTTTPLSTDTLCSQSSTMSSTPSLHHQEAHQTPTTTTHRPPSAMLAKPPIARVKGKVRQVQYSPPQHLLTVFSFCCCYYSGTSTTLVFGVNPSTYLYHFKRQLTHKKPCLK